MNVLARLLLIVLLPVLPVIDGVEAKDVHLFQTEQQAQQYCPTDVVVWVNTASGVYHYRGQRWCAHTRNGAFVCRKDADEYGYRPTRNGQ